MANRYRPKTSYHGKTPEAKARQMANLQCRWKKDRPAKPVEDRFSLKRLQSIDVIEFAVECLGISFQERPAQEVVLRCLYGLPLSAEQVELYRKLTTNETVFEHNIEKTEACWAVGARGGKSMLSSVVALYESICRGHIWQKYLQQGETGYCIIIATRQVQAEQIIQANCGRMLSNSKIAYMMQDSWHSELLLKNGMRIASFPCNSTAARGLPIFQLIFDELAHYRIEGPKADEKIYSSLRPRQAQFPGAKCLKISTPAAKQGLLWDEFSEGFQVPSRLTIQADTRTLNPVVPQEFIDKEYKRDPDNAEREFGAKFAEQVQGFFASCIDALSNCFTLSANEDLPYSITNKYFAAIDQSGLSATGDRWAFTIAHKDQQRDKVMVDARRSWQTKDLDLILAEIALLCQVYRIKEVVIDRYAKGFVEAAFKAKGLSVIVRELLPVVYTTFKTLVIAGKVLLPDYKPLRTGLFLTQAYYGKSNTLSIGHERTRQGHGDEADSCTTACSEASKNRISYQVLSPEEAQRQWEQEDADAEYDVLGYGLR